MKENKQLDGIVDDVPPEDLKVDPIPTTPADLVINNPLAPGPSERDEKFDWERVMLDYVTSDEKPKAGELADKYSIPRRTIEHHIWKDRWNERRATHQAKLYKSLEKKLVATHAELKMQLQDRYLKLSQAAASTIIRDIRKGKCSSATITQAVKNLVQANAAMGIFAEPESGQDKADKPVDQKVINNLQIIMQQQAKGTAGSETITLKEIKSDESVQQVKEVGTGDKEQGAGEVGPG